ncbi:MAG TPA: methyltransferase domain-containing protein [Methanomicrobiales archaeon]|jgi:ubiquinone/menaquinone biosynthesis C-methylase UbiE|nr:methyltransferase domain-containing protein [Methanomicrobiales archaeon]
MKRRQDRSYVHGYSRREAGRLLDQARTLAGLLHHDTGYPPGSLVLEAGCGIGAQTVTLAEKSPGAEITSIDVSDASLREAEARVRAAGFTNVTFRQADIYSLPFADGSFDHVFLCFVLEHLPDPDRALSCLHQMLAPGGTITVIEGDHGSAYFHPDSEAARKAIGCLIALQKEKGGNALIGRELFPLLTRAGFREVSVSPRMVYVDASHPELVEGFTKQTFTAMVEGVEEEAVGRGMMSRAEWDQGIRDLYRTCEADGTFCYTFFKGWGLKGQ